MARPRAEPTATLRALLWASEALYAAELDHHGLILDANPGLCRGAGRERLDGTEVSDLLARGQRPALLAAVAAATEEWRGLTLTFLGPGGEATDDRAVRLLRTGDRVLMVAEPARADRDHLVEQVLELNDELVAAQRSLGRRQRELERSRAEAEAATRRAAQLEAITFAGLARPDDALTELLGIARTILGSDGATLTLLHEDGRTLRERATAGLAPAPDPALVRAVAESGRPRLTDTFAGVPLMLDGSVAGVLQVQSARAGAFAKEDLRLLEAVGERAALVVGHAQLRERERRISETLQRSLLQQRLPEVPGLTLAARYRPQAHAVHVGGDFYDATVLPGGRVSLAIGDVAGKGLRAAAVMGQIRSALRAYVLDGRSPGEVLDRLDRLVVEADDFATALHLILDPATGEIELASAGHPPVLVRAASGAVAFAKTPAAPPLGVGWHERREDRLVLAPGEMLLLYTDGLFERRGKDPNDRLDVLRAATESASGDLAASLDHLIAALAGDGFGDDVALLAVRRDGPPG